MNVIIDSESSNSEAIMYEDMQVEPQVEEPQDQPTNPLGPTQ